MNKDVELIKPSEDCTKHTQLTFIDFFSGIGGFHSGFEKAGMECIGWCEFDKFARRSYEALYDTKEIWTACDIRSVNGKDLPKAYLWAFGFPCQDISIAGNKKGIIKGTRSGLFYEIMRLLDECEENKPRWLVCENVKNLLSIDNGWGMFNVLAEMDKRGYDAEWKVYNSKNYGVPQNRERVYIVGHIRNGSTTELLPVARENSATIKQIGNLINTNSFGGNPQRGRVYTNTGISQTLNTCQGGGRAAKVLTSGCRRANYAVDVNGISCTICARDYKGQLKIATNTNTLTTNNSFGVVLQDGSYLAIRKMTPREYWRLQGFTDEQFDKASAVNSNSQLYKQAGNAVTVNVAYEIGKHLVKINSQD